MGEVIKFPSKPGKDGRCPACGSPGPFFELLMGGVFPEKVLEMKLEVRFICPGCETELTQKLERTF